MNEIMLNFIIWSAHDCTLLQKALDVAEVCQGLAATVVS